MSKVVPDEFLTTNVLLFAIYEENFKFIVGCVLVVDAPSIVEPTPTTVPPFMTTPKSASIPESDSGFPAEITVPLLIIRYPLESIPSPSEPRPDLLLKFPLLSRLLNHLPH